MKLAFISDLHLSPYTAQSNQIFFDLLMKWRRSLDGLYILGDFFDYYLGDDDNNDFITSVKQALMEFNTYVPTHFMVGNHDFAVGNSFAKETGVNLISDLSSIKVDGHTILLSHGDTFCTLDVKYQRLKKILRNPLLIYILRQTPLSWRYKLKEILENKSAETFNKEAASTYLVVDDTISKIANKTAANTVIHGHTHNPGLYRITSGDQVICRYEIPDWKDHYPGGYVMLENGQFSIFIPKLDKNTV